MLWAWGVVLSCLLVFLVARTGRVVAAADPAGEYDIGSIQDFAAYSLAYRSGSYNPADVLNISISSGTLITNNEFVSLGTEERPFAGTLNLMVSGIDIFNLYECPLFDYVSTDMTVTTSEGAPIVKIYREQIQDESAVAEVLTSGALFANHVVAGSGAANWSISLEGSTASSFEGLIGTIADGCDVTISFANAANASVRGSGNIGYICGTLGDGASLTVTTTGTGSALSVSTTGGHAGGIVGMMGEGAILTLKSANNTRVTEVTTASGYAGGIVGYVSEVNDTSSDGIQLGAGVTDYAVSGTVTGALGAGGLFGYYLSEDDSVSFSLQNTYAIASGMVISSSGETGGVFGKLISNGSVFAFNGNASGGETLTVSLSDGTSRGGVCGLYQTDALTNRFSLSNTSVTLTANTTDPTVNRIGGLVGAVSDSPAYVQISGVTCTASGTSNGNAPGGGLIGDAGAGGSFIDVSGNVTVSGQFYAGLVETLSEGVLRIAGTTDLSGYVQHNSSNDWTSGAIVRTRGRSLIYALGSGENAGWTLKRNTSVANTIDDVHTWGQVLRVDGTKLTENGLFTVDMTAHTVTVKSGVTTLSTATDFAKTALNIQLGTATGKGALLFQTSKQASTLLAATLTLGADLDVSGTGLTGLTRDDGVNGSFSGTFDGNGHSLTVSVGDVYGRTSAGAALPGSSTDGNIRRHLYNGLFAKTNNATFEDLTLIGEYTVLQDVDATYIGGLAAYSTGSLTLTNVTMTDNVSTGLRIVYNLSTNYTTYVGGAVGYASGSSLDVSVSGGSYRPRITDLTPSDRARGKKTYVGGVIGFIGDGSSQEIAFDDTTIGLTYTKTVNPIRESCFGSAIAGTSNQAYAKDKRKISLTDVDVKMSATGTAANNVFGGILGTEWLSADVTLDGVDIVSAVVTESNSAAAYFGGMVQNATGHWDVSDFTLTDVDYSVKATGSTFGLLTNQTSSSVSALYLELDDAHYNVGASGALDFSGSTGTFTRFDEIAADTRYRSTNLQRNGNSVVSIKTSGNVIDAAYDSYQNKTDYGKTANGAINQNARYYYDVGYAVTNIGTDPKYNLYALSVKEYAHSSIKAWFGDPSRTISGTVDLTGLSYYPVDLADDVAFSSATVILDNNTMQDRVKYAYSSDGGSRTTRTFGSQHYLMHAALFLNVPSDITITGTAEPYTAGLTLRGNVPRISSSICGFLVAGTLGDTDNPTPTEFNATDIVLDGVYILNPSTDARYTYDAYYPLLINKIGRNTNLTLDGLTQTNYGLSLSGFAGSSLIGDVGSTTAHGIRLTFSRIVLDGRNTASTGLPAATTTALNGVYGTSKSIFKRATLLNSFLYAGESSGSYNFTIDEDWNTSTHAARHLVTYGYEITTSVDHPGKQNKYSGSTTIYTDPSSDAKTSDPYDFTSKFLRYVYTEANSAEYKRELSVNINLDAIITGFGKYDKPYLIDNGEKLAAIAGIIAGDNVGSKVHIGIPSDLSESGLFNYTSTGYTEYNFAFDPSSYTPLDGGTAVSNDNVRRYLAGAYYAITEDIELPSDFVSIGQGSAGNPEYVFHGVIFGSGGFRMITNKSSAPLIFSSNGCVLKDLAVHVAPDDSGSHVIELSSGNVTFQYGSGQISYGALIQQILGGDTIIDNVKVTFETTEGKAAVFCLRATGSNNNRLIPVGGYVGTLVNGGLIFRNMRREISTEPVSYESYAGLTSSTLFYSYGTPETTFSAVNNDGYLYVNPVIGRVLAGYAFCEDCEIEGDSDEYAVFSAFSNGTKNYALANLDPSLPKLTISNAGSQYTIDVKNGQAMYVLGAIVNSGAASAAYNASTEQAYETATLSDFWQAYRGWTETRSGATYDYVGTLNPGADPESDVYADYTAAQADAYDSGVQLKGIPYIIRAYTAKNGSVYYARALTRRNNNIISVTGDCDVASGFRGIGSIYTDASRYEYDRVHLGIASMTGTGSPTITLHMEFYEYDTSVTSYRVVNAHSFATYEANAMFSSNAGFGLFNRLYQTGTTGYIEGFTLSGSIVYGLRQVSNGAVQSPTLEAVKGYTVLNVGALAGTAYCQDKSNYYFYTGMRIRNVSLSGLTVEGPRHAGGLIGCVVNAHAGNGSYATMARYYVTNCPVSTTTVRGGKTAGSYFGYANIAGNSNGANAARLTITGDTTLVDGVSRKTTVAPTAITVFGPADAWLERLNPAAGGLIGCADVGYYASADSHLCIQHVIVSGGTVSATDSESIVNNSQIDNQAGFPSAGGVIGKVRGAKLKVTDCEVLGVDLAADATGGVLGCIVIPRDSSSVFERIRIDGDKGDSTVAEMDAWLYAGGVIGRFFAKNTSTYTFKDIQVSNYDVTSRCDLNVGTAGGILGCVYIGTDAGKTFGFSLRNLSVTDCTLTADTTNSNTAYRKGVGGLFGALSGFYDSKAKAYNTTYTGYNLFVDATLAGSGTGSAGAVVGNNVDNKAIIKLVGVSANVDPGGKTLSFTENANGGYSVYSDYSQVQTNTAYAGLNAAGAADDYTDVTPTAHPYATTNPVFTFGGLTLVGDGIADSVPHLPIQAILTGYAGGSLRYGYAAATRYSGSVASTNYQIFNAEKSRALTMFSSEAPEYEGVDFPVLLVDTTDADDSHKLVNSYIRLLTNTTMNYNDEDADQYEIFIYNVTYSAGTFSLSNSGASLKWTGNEHDKKFKMSHQAYDSGKVQFSLLDVRFFDPSDGETVAYHLYVPVFVKKVLTFEFDVAAQSGTTYLESLYTSLFGQRLIANIGAPITVYFRYSYSRTASEWEAAINGGEPVHRHYDKELILQKANNNAILKAFDEGKSTETILVLIDKNDGGRPYYAKLSEALSGTAVDLSVFRSVMEKDLEGNYVFSGAYFIPPDFADMLSYTAGADPEGSLVPCSASDATVIVWQGYRRATSAELADGGVTKYSLSASTSADGKFVACATGAQIVISAQGYRRATADELVDNEIDKYAISASADAEGSYVACDAEDATVRVYGQGYRPATDEEIASAVTTYSVTVDSIDGGRLTESYYLSIYTEGGADYDLFHYFFITTPTSMTDGTYPARITDPEDLDATVHLVMGKIFDHSASTLAISSRSNVGPLLMTSGDNDTLIVNLSVQIGISSDLGALRNEVRSYVSTTGFYQSFLLYLTRHEGSAQNKAILGNPTVSGSYAVDHTLNGVADEVLGAYGGGSIHVNQSYAEFVTGNLGSEFAVIGNYTVEVNAEVRLQYLQDGAVFAQFPGRNGEDDNGVSISASSNIAFSPTATSFSKNSISRNESGSKLYYSEADVKNATLTVSPYGDNEGDYTPYGINALNDPPETLNALLSLNYTSIIDQVRWQYADAVVTVTLRQKQSNGSYGNSDIANIAQYIPSLSFGESAATTAGHPSYYSAVIDAEDLTEEAVEILFPQLSFHVKTGSEFESAGLTYGNYRLTVSVVLRDAFGEEISASKCSEYVIYTNAKVVASFIVNN